MKRFLTLFLVSLLVAIGAMLGSGVTSAQAINPEQTRPEGVVAVLTPHVNYFFSDAVRRNQYAYRAPRAIFWLQNNPVSSCRMPLGNAYYCANTGDESIYIDYNLFHGLIYGGSAYESGRRFADDYAAGVMFVHEWGHHISKILGWRDWAGSRRLYAGQELQADCYAGLFTRYALDRGLINANDVAWARYILYNLGDGMARNPNFYDWTSSNSHGSGVMRDYWFRVGYEQQSLVACGRNLFRAVHGV